jgi:hypothetical protein
MTDSLSFPSKFSSYTKRVRDRLIRTNYGNYVMIKDLLWHYCFLWFSAFERKKILRLDVFFHSLLGT